MVEISTGVYIEITGDEKYMGVGICISNGETGGSLMREVTGRRVEPREPAFSLEACIRT